MIDPLALAIVAAALAVAQEWRIRRLRKRHDCCKATLNRVASERDNARYDLMRARAARRAGVEL